MVFARKITTKGKSYWILVHNIREGKNIRQKSKYIGKTLPPEEDLKKMKEEFLNDIKKDNHRYLSDDIVKNIENKKETYQKELKKLSKTEREQKQEEFMIRYTYDSSKLSGVPVTLRQTFLILKEGIIPKEMKSLRIAKELENHEKGFLMITQYIGPLTKAFLKKLHKTLLAGIDDSIAGKFRSELKRDVKIAGTIYLPPKWQHVEKELDQFLSWYAQHQRKLHPLELAALVHAKLISLQPFVDGNSRLSRLLMNSILWKKNYPPIDIPVTDLEAYYNALDFYQIEKDEREFVQYIVEKYLDG